MSEVWPSGCRFAHPFQLSRKFLHLSSSRRQLVFYRLPAQTNPGRRHCRPQSRAEHRAQGPTFSSTVRQEWDPKIRSLNWVFYMFFFTCIYGGGGASATAWVWRSEDTLKLLLSSLNMEFWGLNSHSQTCQQALPGPSRRLTGDYKYLPLPSLLKMLGWSNKWSDHCWIKPTRVQESKLISLRF